MTMTAGGWRTRAAIGAALVGGVVGLALWEAESPAPAAAATVAQVHVFFPRGTPTARCDRVLQRPRTVPAPAVLTGAMRALLAGPTPPERRAGYRGWFSARTRGMLRGARVAGGVAYIDFRDFSGIIPSASSSCGSATLLAQLDRTATQFPTVRRTVYSFDGSRSAFYEWLQRSAPR
jgi:hypothetical protein